MAAQPIHGTYLKQNQWARCVRVGEEEGEVNGNSKVSGRLVLSSMIGVQQRRQSHQKRAPDPRGLFGFQEVTHQQHPEDYEECGGWVVQGEANSWIVCVGALYHCTRSHLGGPRQELLTLLSLQPIRVWAMTATRRDDLVFTVQRVSVEVDRRNKFTAHADYRVGIIGT
mmetsp:Transcript_3215/g.4381  ORF Transcript_3215/g.4381 Transcript_3215/m.4381 type:complete len:169 (+) Transcript_3215:606-1112(+)